MLREETLRGDAFTLVVYVKTLLLPPKHIFLFLCCSIPSVLVHPSQTATLTSPDKAKHSQEEPSVRMELHVLLIPRCS